MGREAIWKYLEADCIFMKFWAVPRSISLSLCLLSEISLGIYIEEVTPLWRT